MELETEAGQVNALLILLCSLFVVAIGAPNLAEQVIGLWSDDYRSSFPSIAALAILMGGGLICVLMLLLLEPLLQARRPRQRKKRRRAKTSGR